jgi:DNA-binding PadR family transcriptional regulator
VTRESRSHRIRKPSPQTIAVLQALAAEPSKWRYGYELGREVGLKAGSLYPILIRLSDRQLVEASWENEPSPGRPPRHLYRLTDSGLEMAAEFARPAPEASPGVPVSSAPVPATSELDAAGHARATLRGAW